MKRTYTFDTFSVPVETAGMDPKDVAVLDALEEADGAKLHQVDIARSKPWLGCHPLYESDLPIPDPTASSLRGIRGRINRIRRKHNGPVLSEPKRHGGYWIPKLEAEIRKNMADRRETAIAQALGNLGTYDDMLETFKVLDLRDSFFEDLRQFMQRYQRPPKPPKPKRPKKPKKPPPPKKPPEDNGEQGDFDW